MISDSHAVSAVGYLSSELAARADAWNGNAPDWFPEPPEWIDLWERALLETDDGFEDAMLTGERSHLLTVGSPARGLCLRITLGRMARTGIWHPWQPCVFLIWRGKRL
jgi:hypothetical protein